MPKSQFQDLKITNVPISLINEIKSIAKGDLGITTSQFLKSKMSEIVKSYKGEGGN